MTKKEKIIETALKLFAHHGFIGVSTARIAKEAQDKNPKSVLQKTIMGLLEIPKEDYNFWKLQYKLKIDDNYDTRDKVQPFIDCLAWAFSELKYSQPELEAQLLFEVVDNTLKQIVQNKLNNKEEFVRFLLRKYKLE